jgi:hypothetical protein
MRMILEMDAGPIIHQIRERIGPSETATELGTRLSELGAEALIEALALLEENASEEVEQDPSKATFAPKVNREMARVDWNRLASPGTGSGSRGLVYAGWGIGQALLACARTPIQARCNPGNGIGYRSCPRRPRGLRERGDLDW